MWSHKILLFIFQTGWLWFLSGVFPRRYVEALVCKQYIIFELKDKNRLCVSISRLLISATTLWTRKEEEGAGRRWVRGLQLNIIYFFFFLCQIVNDTIITRHFQKWCQCFLSCPHLLQSLVECCRNVLRTTKHHLDCPSAWGREDNDWIIIFGRAVPLIQKQCWLTWDNEDKINKHNGTQDLQDSFSLQGYSNSATTNIMLFFPWCKATRPGSFSTETIALFTVSVSVLLITGQL